jgi:hypothetical protein
MINNPKSTSEAPAEPQREPAMENVPFMAFAALMHKSVERLAEMQKLTLDIAARQTTDVISAWKTMYKTPPETPWTSALDFAGQSVERMALTQKGVIDLVVQQSAHLVETYKVRTEVVGKNATATADVITGTADRVAAAQKLVLDFAAAQNKAAAETMKQQSGIAGSTPMAAAVETVQRNVDVAIQAQKEMVQAATKPVKAAASSSAA